jgi:hypothetical protein
MGRKNFLILTSLLLLISTTYLTVKVPLISLATSDSSPVLYVNPDDYKSAYVGEHISIQVLVSLVFNLAGFHFKVSYNNLVLQCLDASIGSLFPLSLGIPIIIINNTVGEIYIQSRTVDINLDGTVNLPDLVILAKAYGSQKGSLNWNPNADLNNDGKINLPDLVKLSKNYQKHTAVSGFGALLSMTFNATYGTPYPYREKYQIAIFDDALLSAGNPPQQIPHSVLNGTYETPIIPPELELTLNTDKDRYLFNEKINITGSLRGNGYPIPDALVALQILDATNHTVALRTLPTSSMSITCPIEIIGLYPCSSDGTPQYVFPIKAIATFNVTLKNKSSNDLNALIYVNLYDSSNASIGVAILFHTIQAGSTAQFLLGIPIQENTTSGYATAYAGVLTDYPNNWGTALSTEKSTALNITGSQNGTPTFNRYLPQGNFGTILSFHYIGQASGNYTIISTTAFMGKNAIQIKQVLISQQ